MLFFVRAVWRRVDDVDPLSAPVLRYLEGDVDVPGRIRRRGGRHAIRSGGPRLSESDRDFRREQLVDRGASYGVSFEQLVRFPVAFQRSSLESRPLVLRADELGVGCSNHRRRSIEPALRARLVVKHETAIALARHVAASQSDELLL